jgi:DNA-binding CsgD family transcriptional regulator
MLEEENRRVHRQLLTKGLTRREVEVLYWVRKGKANSDISAILNIKTATVKKHLQRVYAKLDVENRTAAAYFAPE